VSGLAARLPVEACGTLLRRAAEPGARVVAARGLEVVAVTAPRGDGWEVTWRGCRLVVRAAIVQGLIAPVRTSPRLGIWRITEAGRVVLAEIVDRRDRQGHLLRELRELREEVEILRARTAEVEPVAPTAAPGLTATENAVVRRLRQGLQNGVTRASIHEAVMALNGTQSSIKMIDVLVSKLRGKGFTIETIWGRGYRLVAEPGDAAPEAPGTPSESPATPPVSDPSETPLQPA
jgi:hypothetical protein